MEARITDHTAGFDWPDQAELPADDSESGRGVFLIQSLTDHSVYLRGADENCLVLRSNRETSDTAPHPPGVHDLMNELLGVRRTLDLMTEELASAYESLSAIFRFSEELQGGGASEDFVSRWLDQMLEITEAEWLVMRVCGRSPGELRLVTRSGDADRFDALPADLPLGSRTSVEVRAASDRADVWFDEFAPLEAADPLADLAGGGCGFAHPVVVNDSLVSVISLGRRDQARPFTAGQLSVVHTFGDFLGLQMRSSQLQAAQVRAQLDARDLEIAANLQKELLPAQMPSLPGLSLASYYRSARQVGGDYYDVIPLAEGQLLLAIADVMGKGAARRAVCLCVPRLGEVTIGSG